MLRCAPRRLGSETPPWSYLQNEGWWGLTRPIHSAGCTDGFDLLKPRKALYRAALSRAALSRGPPAPGTHRSGAVLTPY